MTPYTAITAIAAAAATIAAGLYVHNTRTFALSSVQAHHYSVVIHRQGHAAVRPVVRGATPAFHPQKSKGGAADCPWNHLPIRVYFDKSFNIYPVQQQIAEHSFNQWTEATGGKLQWVKVPAKHAVDIVVYLRMADEDSRTNDDSHGYMEWAHVILCWDTRSGDGVSAADNFRICAAHEFGHAIGLTNHSSHPSDLMFGYTHTSKIQPRDLARLNRIYGWR